MVLDLTTAERVKGVLGVTGTDRDDRIGELIQAVSQEAEVYLGKHAEADRRVEVYDLRAGHRLVRLRGAPVTQIHTLRYSYRVGMTDPQNLVLADVDVRMDRGQIYLPEGVVPEGAARLFLQVDYEGGMAQTTAAFMSAYPRIAEAVGTEVINRLNRGRTPEGNLRSLDGSVAYQTAIETLPDLYAALAPYRRIRL